MQFELNEAREILERTPATLRAMLGGLSEAWTEQNEGPDTWSAFDIVGHLVHGEKTDWTERMSRILDATHDGRFEPFDRFAQFEDSKGKTLAQLLDEFAIIRARNLITLDAHEISHADLAREGIHPAFGTVTLRQLIATWAVHDLGHTAQVARVLAKAYRDEIGPWQEFIPIVNL